MPEPEAPSGADFDAALAAAGLAPATEERDRALEAARRLRRAVALLRDWNAAMDPDGPR